MTLLTTNAKLDKHNGEVYLVTGLAMAPHVLGGHGTVCSASTVECRRACNLWLSGRTMMSTVRRAMIARTRFFFEDPVRFHRQLEEEIAAHVRRADRGRLLPAIRLNVASDLDWSHVARQWPEVRLYDYTKVRARLTDRTWPSNYELTLSRTERHSATDINRQLRRGGNVAVVFSTRYHPQSGRIDPLPLEWRIGRTTWPVVDGDVHDVRLREIDGSGVIVGLRFKGNLIRRAKAIQTGFAIDVN